MDAAKLGRRRLGAWMIDGLLVLGLLILLPGSLGFLALIAYTLVRDGLFSGQSVGKRIVGLKVVSDVPGRGPYATSLVRNILWVIPVLDLVFAVTGLYALLHDPDGRHWGDRLAGTRVVPA